LPDDDRTVASNPLTDLTTREVAEPAAARQELAAAHPVASGSSEIDAGFEALYRALFEHSADGVLLTKPDGTILRASPSACLAFGRSDTEIRRLGRAALVVDDDALQAFLRERERAGVAKAELTHRRADGTPFPVEVSSAVILTRNGEPYTYIIFRDITERKKAQDALRESEHRVRLKLDSILSPDGDIGTLEFADIIDSQALQSLMDDFYKLARVPMSLVDLKGKLLVGVGWQEICTNFHRVHPETCKHCIESDTQLSAAIPPGECRLHKCKNNMWDFATPVSVGGKHLGNIFSGQFFFEDETLDHDLFRAQAARYGFDERAYLAALEAVPRLSRESVAVGMAFFLKLADMLSRVGYSNVKLARSSTEREALMASLQRSKERLEEADHRKSEFIAVLSHELRNPLAPIRNSLYLLDRGQGGSEQGERAKAIIRRQTEHLARLVDDLLDVTRISRGKITLTRTRIDARDAVRRTCEDHQAVFDQRGVQLRLELPARQVWIDADATRISQVVGNLLQNAAKFTPQRGSTSVSVRAVDGRAEIRVRDDGIGIEPELLGQIFEPFAQAERGLARTQGGLGLGLALVKGLVELHGGAISARSEGADRGSEFVVSLPLVADTDVARAEARPRRSEGTRLVLVIEDNVDSGESLAEVLALEGHRVHVATDGRSGIAKTRELLPDVVLCDIGLPDTDGYEIARTVRGDGELRSTHLIALSGYAQPEDKQRAAEAGFDAHLAKPARLEELTELIAQAPLRAR